MTKKRLLVKEWYCIISAISKDNGKVLDFAVFTKDCISHKYWEKK